MFEYTSLPSSIVDLRNFQAIIRTHFQNIIKTNSNTRCRRKYRLKYIDRPIRRGPDILIACMMHAWQIVKYELWKLSNDRTLCVYVNENTWACWLGCLKVEKPWILLSPLLTFADPESYFWTPRGEFNAIPNTDRAGWSSIKIKHRIIRIELIWSKVQEVWWILVWTSFEFYWMKARLHWSDEWWVECIRWVHTLIILMKINSCVLINYTASRKLHCITPWGRQSFKNCWKLSV